MCLQQKRRWRPQEGQEIRDHLHPSRYLARALASAGLEFNACSCPTIDLGQITWCLEPHLRLGPGCDVAFSIFASLQGGKLVAQLPWKGTDTWLPPRGHVVPPWAEGQTPPPPPFLPGEAQSLILPGWPGLAGWHSTGCPGTLRSSQGNHTK